MCGAPSVLDDKQLREAHIKLNLPIKPPTPPAAPKA
jgi:hypothetical protein